ncbi:hypothetical protein B0H34DRAFT_801324 [Crassisporium funariophilum]|nr:hypothetical protein B0H34DRAFT_801324 [Crassisporium funariophilum]
MSLGAALPHTSRINSGCLLSSTLVPLEDLSDDEILAPDATSISTSKSSKRMAPTTTSDDNDIPLEKMHKASALFVNPSRRFRLIAASLHASFLQIPIVHDQIILFLRETASPSQAESIIGTWCLTAHDVDRQVAAIAFKTWKDTVTLHENLSSSLHLFVQRAILDPSGVYTYLNPVPPPAPLAPVKRNAGKLSSVSTPGGDQTPRLKIDEQEESKQDRRARLRIAALGAARWILGSTPTLPEDFFSNPALWSSLNSSEICPWVEMESFGFGQPNVRKAAWSLLQSLVTTHKEAVRSLLPTLSTAVLRSAWMELDTMVQATLWQPLLVFLKQYPQSWTLDMGENDNEEDVAESEESRPNSRAYQEFLRFLQLGCSGSPQQGYPTVVLIVSTIPSSGRWIMFSSTDEAPLTQFFTSFWEAINGRALSSLHRVAASSAFLSSLLECIVFLIKRMQSDNAREERDPSTPTNEFSETLVKAQLSRVWDEISNKKLRVEERAAARLVARTLESLSEVDQSLFDAAWEALARSIASDYFLLPSGYNTFLQVITAKFTSSVAHVIEGESVPTTAFDVSMLTILHSLYLSPTP